jgi:hypothetical protein
VKSQVITIVRDRDISAPVIGDVAEAALTVYKLADNATRTLLQRDRPGQRFPHAADLRIALAALPELAAPLS